MKIFGIKIHALRYKKFLEEILLLEKQNIVFTPNPEILLKAKDDESFKKLLQKANYLTPDGIGLYIAFQILDNRYSKYTNTLLLPYYFFHLFFRREYLYKKYGERICGSDLTKDILIYAEEKNISLTIIDLYNPKDSKKVASQQKFSQKLQAKFPKLDFDYYIYNPKEKKNIIDKIKKGKSQILFSTLGMQKQEESIVDIMDKCSNLKLGLGVGSSFDYIIGFQKRAPKFWRILGIEWLYRLITGPRKKERLLRLYNAIFVFIGNILKEK